MNRTGEKQAVGSADILQQEGAKYLRPLVILFALACLSVPPTASSSSTPPSVATAEQVPGSFDSATTKELLLLKQPEILARAKKDLAAFLNGGEFSFKPGEYAIQLSVGSRQAGLYEFWKNNITVRIREDQTGVQFDEVKKNIETQGDPIRLFREDPDAIVLLQYYLTPFAQQSQYNPDDRFMCLPKITVELSKDGSFVTTGHTCYRDGNFGNLEVQGRKSLFGETFVEVFYPASIVDVPQLAPLKRSSYAGWSHSPVNSDGWEAARKRSREVTNPYLLVPKS